MKLIKNKKLIVCRLLNANSGDEVFLNFRPTKKEILEIAKDEDWGGFNRDVCSEKEINEEIMAMINAGEYCVDKLEICGK